MEMFKCSCGLHGLELVYQPYEHGGEDIFLRVWVVRWYDPDAPLRERLKELWGLVTGRGYLASEVCLSREDLKKLRDAIDTILRVEGDER